MRRWIRRLLALTLVGAVLLAVMRSRRPSPEHPPTVAPESTWPPIVVPAGVTVGLEPDVDATDWVTPADDHSCPIGYPVKANDNSHIFHVPGGRFYDRTHAERCYATAEAAERDGYRRAKA